MAFFGYENGLHTARLVFTIRRRWTAYDQNMIPLEPKTPHALMKSPHVQVPYMETLGQVVPRDPIGSVVHFDIKDVSSFVCVRHEICLTRRLGVVKGFGVSVAKNKTRVRRSLVKERKKTVG